MAPLTQDEVAGNNNTTAAPGGSKPQPVAVEIPVTVNGARTLAGSDKREPFSETTQTVLVFGAGAVIRLVAAVGPGQLLFVTNEKSKQEVVCQVVKSKQNGAAGGYVELKFTELAADFWGIRFSAGAPAAGPSIPPKAIATVISMPAPTKSLEQKLTEMKSVPPPAPQPAIVPDLPKRSETVSPAASTLTVSSPASVQVAELPAPPVVSPAPVSAPKIPTLSEFLTHGTNGLELRQERGKGDTIASVSKTASQIHTDANLPKVHLSAALANEAKKAEASAAPGSASFDFAVDEVKIPSWLEPLARNSTDASPAAPAFESKLPDLVKSSEVPAPDSAGLPERDPSIAAIMDSPETPQASFTISNEGPTPTFSASLNLGSETSAAQSGAFNWKIIAAVIALLLAGAAAWYWYSNQSTHADNIRSNARPEMSEPASAPAPAVSNPVNSSTANTASASLPAMTSPTSVHPADKQANLLAARSSSTPLNPNSGASHAAVASPVIDIPVDEPAKKPGLGEVHLAAPKLKSNKSSAANDVDDPGLALNAVSGADAANLDALASSKGKQPAAPVMIGGDVKPARLLSSAPPVYPQLARTQRVSGAVVVDALIDANGHVSATRVISGPALLHEAAMEAVRKWQYQPATLNGQPTSMHLSVTVQFKLQ